MVLKGKVMHLTEMTEGVSQKGKPYQMIGIVVKTLDEYPSEFALYAVNSSISQLVGVSVGSLVKIQFYTHVVQRDHLLYNNFYIKYVDVFEPGKGKSYS